MNTARLIFKNTFALSIASAGQLIGNMVLFFYLSRLLQAEGLGIYSTVIAIFHTASLGCGIGFTSFLPRELPKDLSKTNKYLIHASLVSVATALFIVVCLSLITPHLGYLLLTDIGIKIISLALIPESMMIVLFAVFIAHQKAEFVAITGVISVLGRILFSLLALQLGFGVIGLIVIYTVFSFLSLAINLFFLKRYVLIPHWEFDSLFLKKMMFELKVFAALALLNAVFSQSEVLILSFTQGETQVGYYSAALKLVTIWAMVPSSYLTALFPVLSATFQEYPQKVISLQNKSLKYLIAAALPLAVGMTVLAGLIIPLIYGPIFSQSIVPLKILSWYLPLIFLNNLLWRVLFVRGEQKVVFRWQLVTEIIQVFLAVWLTPKIGSIGAALSVFGGNLAYFIYFIFFLKHVKSPLPLIQIGWKFLLASTIMGLFTWLCSPKIPLIMLVPIAALIYLFLLWILRAFSNDDIGSIKEIFKNSKNQHYSVGSDNGDLN